MAEGRPGFSIKSPQEPCYMEDHKINDQVGFYAQKTQPGVEDINSRVGQTPAAPDDRFTNVIGTVDKAVK